ncbi:uncharacterized protein LOC127751798, partial [Frankliniella occidentalis]|uniref:Uncharacterized protein LOC127751798 n=1 Tax=Frankliniella occidentalis TaxID=133901 RepID=A0A9C6XA42_FRAOC
MEKLPKSALVTVMQHLTATDLLTCRLVSKSLGALALQPEVWRHQEVAAVRGGRREPCLCAVLRVAPCLGEVVVNETFRKPHIRALSRTKCPVAVVVIHLYQDTRNAREAAQVIRNQQALGRLRRVELKCNVNLGRLSGVDKLIRTLLAATSALEELVVTGGVPYTLCPIEPVPHGPSLKRFTFSSSPGNPLSRPLVEAVLAGHADTLEEVDLGFSGEAPISASTSRLLAKVTNLRKLKCQMMQGMEAVAACEKLTDLSILAYSDQCHRGAVKFITQAQQLTRVNLDYRDLEGNPVIGKALGQALVTSRSRARLEELSIGCLSLPTPLSPLPALQQLNIMYPPKDGDELRLLLAVTPATAPALRKLVLQVDFWRKCAHSWMHNDAVQKALALNPSLHIQVGVYDAAQLRNKVVAVEGTSMEHLPTELLEKVMGHLAVRDLLALRLVCKRLGDVAVRPRVWRHRRLDLASAPAKPCACVVLRVAPRLRRMQLYAGSDKYHTRALVETNCAVDEVVLHLCQQEWQDTQQ